MDQVFRAPTDEERALFGKMLEIEFPGREEVREQLSSAKVKQVDTDGTLAFETSATMPAPVVCGVPVEGQSRDEDGTPIHVLLLIVDGVVNRLEIFREDALEVMRPPVASELSVVVGVPDELS